jgi:hypothetical protein
MTLWSVCTFWQPHQADIVVPSDLTMPSCSANESSHDAPRGRCHTSMADWVASSACSNMDHSCMPVSHLLPSLASLLMWAVPCLLQCHLPQVLLMLPLKLPQQLLQQQAPCLCLAVLLLLLVDCVE